MFLKNTPSSGVMILINHSVTARHSTNGQECWDTTWRRTSTHVSLPKDNESAR